MVWRHCRSYNNSSYWLEIDWDNRNCAAAREEISDNFARQNCVEKALLNEQHSRNEINKHPFPAVSMLSAWVFLNIWENEENKERLLNLVSSRLIPFNLYAEIALKPINPACSTRVERSTCSWQAQYSLKHRSTSLEFSLNQCLHDCRPAWVLLTA
jgi:hypothetical protein